MAITAQSRPLLTYLTVAVVSFSGVVFELVQTRILSFIFWNHIVYLTISIGLLGFGISGTVVVRLMEGRNHRLERVIASMCGAMSASLLLSLVAISKLLPLLRFKEPSVKLMLCYLVSIPPFVCAGAILSLIFAYNQEAMGRLYRADLIAAGCACVLFFVMLPLLGAVTSVLVLAGMTGAMGLLWTSARPATVRQSFAVVGMGALVLAVPNLSHRWKLDYTPEPYKELGAMSGTVERTQWTTLARIDVVGGSREQLFNYPEHPDGSYKIITQDGSAHTRLLGSAAIQDINERARNGRAVHPSVIPYAILKHPDVAIIGTGGGLDVADALAYQAHSVFGIELNSYTYRVAKEIYADWNGHLMADPRVNSINAEGRSAIRASNRQFDLIQVIAIDTFAALNSGAYVLSENYLYTVEAFHDYFAHLKPGGLLALSRWNSVPPKETLRLTVLAAESWRRQGVTKIDDRVIVIGNPDWAITIFKNGAFTPEEVEKLVQEGNKTGDEVFYWPKLIRPEQQAAFEKNYYAGKSLAVAAGSRAFNNCIEAYQQGTEQQFFRKYPVTPTTDDSPFFFESTRVVDLQNWGVDNWGMDYLRGNGVQNTLFQICAVSTVIMLCAIILPLLIFNRQGLGIRGAIPYTIYFGCLGFGFMTIEISLMQKCVLVLGSPMYSIPVLLAATLVSAGIGSGAAASWAAPFRTKVQLSFAALVGTTAMGIAVLAYGAPAILALALGWRAAIVVMVILPSGLLLGVFFPSGLQTLRDEAPEFVPWAWGINGCASVYGSVLAIVAAMSHGFNFVIVLGLVVYLVAALNARLIPLARSV